MWFPVSLIYMLYALFWVIPWSLNFICQCFRTYTYPPMKMKQTQYSETLAHKIQMPRNYPEESIQHSEHGESLKSFLDLSTAISSTTLNSKGVIASPVLKPLLTLNTEDKCSPILTLAYIFHYTKFCTN